LIEAARYLRTPVKIILAGSSRDPKHYQSLIEQHRVGDRVVSRGFVDEPEIVELYANALGICYLPFDEDYGYVTLEGMLSQKPVVVARDGGGATEFVEHDRDGLIVDPEPRAVAEALDTLYGDRQKAKQMGENARAKLQGFNFSWSHVVERIISAA